MSPINFFSRPATRFLARASTSCADEETPAAALALGRIGLIGGGSGEVPEGEDSRFGAAETPVGTLCGWD